MEKTKDIIPYLLLYIYDTSIWSQQPTSTPHKKSCAEVIRLFVLEMLCGLFHVMPSTIKTRIYPCEVWREEWDKEYDEYRSDSVIILDDIMYTYVKHGYYPEECYQCVITKGPLQITSDGLGTSTPISITVHETESDFLDISNFVVHTIMEDVSIINIIL